jgi:small GTP-binding protein
MATDPRRYKVVFVGDTGVGKTSLIYKFRGCDQEIEPTTGMVWQPGQIAVDGEELKLSIWDTCGQDTYRNMVPTYAKGSEAAILVFDLTNPTSYEHIPEWHAFITGIVGDLVTVLVGNKSDLSSIVNSDEAMAWARTNGSSFLCTSTLTNENVHEVFETIARRLITLKTMQSEDQIVELGTPPVTVQCASQGKSAETTRDKCCG